MSLCPCCGRAYCDHTPSERDQTFEQMLAPLTAEEMAAWESGDSDRKLDVARNRRSRSA